MEGRSKSYKIAMNYRLFVVLLSCFSGSVIAHHTENDSNPVNVYPADRSDVIDGHEVDNRHQCQGLCWYHGLCSSYSYCMTCSGSLNCFLHSTLMQGSNTTEASPPDWVEHSASAPKDGSAGCSSRPCTSTQYCLPTPSGGHSCLGNPTQCDNVTDVPHGILENQTAVFQGDVNRVTCEQHFVISPSDASMEIECQANSTWTSPQGQCLQAEFAQPTSLLYEPFPRTLDTGWGMCLRGFYLGEELVRMRFSTWGCNYGSCDHPFRFNLREFDDNPGYLKVTWDRAINGTLEKHQLDPSYIPKQSNQTSSTFSFKLSDHTLSVRVYGHANYSISIADINAGGTSVGLWNITSIRIKGSTTHVNLVEECTEE